jgi:two-component system phosphate regulon sensor histidine kinase PhoR
MDYLLRTEKSINRMIDIINDLEAISKLESGDLKLNFETFDIVAITRDAVDLLEVKAKKKKNTISFVTGADKPIYVYADKEKIRQVLSNLIDNALKYGRKKSGTTNLGFFDMDENILIEITDDGMGIKKENLQRLFERFYRTEEARELEKSGTGLGLSIVKHIIEAHQQTINVRSTVGVGSTFGFTLKKVDK